MAESIDLTDGELDFLLRMKAAGWQLVPIEASDFMLAAGEAVAPSRARAVLNAMVSEAPGFDPPAHPTGFQVPRQQRERNANLGGSENDLIRIADPRQRQF